MRYLTKSRFKLALDCPTKLFYTGKKEYPDKSEEDSFLAALAEGGFQVGELAKCYFPGGTDIRSLSYDEALEQTNELLQHENAVIYEAAVCSGRLFIRADVLVKKGNKLFLYEVKAKSCDFDDESGFMNASGFLTNDWKPYVYDVAFQKYVLVNAFPDYQISSYLMLVDKNKAATVNGLNQKFQLYKNQDGRTGVYVIGDVDSVALGEQLLIPINVDGIISSIWTGKDTNEPPELSFKEMIEFFAQNYEADKRIDSPITPGCWKCEFYCTEEEEAHGLKSGFKECIRGEFHWTEQDFKKPTVMEIWDNRRKQRFLYEGKVFQSQLTENDLNVNSGTDGLSRTERQWLQVQKSLAGDYTPFFDKDGMIQKMQSFKYPLHFIDFETSMVAIPFHEGRRPYEQIAFQFSHHMLDIDGKIEHAGQYISTDKGEFPNYDFLRALKKQLENDEGTIFRYAAHENTVLNQIYVQLQNERSLPKKEKEELKQFIRSISTSSSNSVESWNAERTMVDMLQMVKLFYYDLRMKGSNSIKVVLPAVLNSSSFLQQKYGQPIYGRNSLIRSLNFEDGWVWLRKDVRGEVINPYKLLPKLFDGVEQTEDFITESSILADGGAAMTAYAKMQFTQMPDDERKALINGLLRYCELDTLAMVMIFEAWREWVDRD